MRQDWAKSTIVKDGVSYHITTAPKWSNSAVCRQLRECKSHTAILEQIDKWEKHHKTRLKIIVSLVKGSGYELTFYDDGKPEFSYTDGTNKRVHNLLRENFC